MTHDFDALSRLVNDSAVGHLARGATGAWRAAAASSRVVALARSLAARRARWTSVDRWQSTAIVIATAAAGHAALVSWAPRYAAPGVPLALWAIIGAGGLVVAIVPAAFVAAWEHAAVARLLRRRTR